MNVHSRLGLGLLLMFSLTGGACGAKRPGPFGIGGPSRQQLVAMAFDPDNADNRREGLYRLSQTDWRTNDKFLDGCKLVLREDPEPSVRRSALSALGRSGDRKHLPDIVAALGDDSPAVRMEAARILDQMPDDLAVVPLTQHALMDPSQDVRMWSARALRHYRGHDALATLIRCLDDASYGVHSRARGSLTEIFGKDMGPDDQAWLPLLAQLAGQGADGGQ